MSDKATIQGYRQSSLRHIDNDIKVTVQRFVKGHLLNLPEAEQHNIEKWLSEELQKERRRQQYRTPNTVIRRPQEFQSVKEVQTEMTGMAWQEFYEELVIQLNGVDYQKMTAELSFRLLKEQVCDLLTRTRQMDFLFLQCLDKFQEADRYQMTLPDHIDKLIMQQKELIAALAEDRGKLQRLREEKENLNRHIQRLEDNFEELFKRQAQSVTSTHPQQLYLKQRKDIQARYTMTQTFNKSKKQFTYPVADSECSGREITTELWKEKHSSSLPTYQMRFKSSSNKSTTIYEGQKRTSRLTRSKALIE